MIYENIFLLKNRQMAELHRYPKVLNFRLRELTNISFKWPNLKVCLLSNLEDFFANHSISLPSEVLQCWPVC
jgi:hypothetical protein